MTRKERIKRLKAVLHGTGASVTYPFGIWALNSRLNDSHISALSGWADLEYLFAGSTLITDDSLEVICNFRRLTDLSIGDTAITGEAIASLFLPPAVENLGLGAIPLCDDAVSTICRCSKIATLFVNNCGLSFDALAELSRLPNLRVIEAIGVDSGPDGSRTLSQRHPDVLYNLSDGLWKNGVCRRPPLSVGLA